jgi:two-component system cell cycle response regulator
MKILIADDDRASIRLLEAFLAKWDYQAVPAHDGEEAWHILQQKDSPKLAILDWMMPGMDGTQVCREIRQHTEMAYVYVVLLTGKNQKNEMIAGLEAGADDYLTKPIDGNELKARLRAGRRILELQDRLLAANHALQFQAAHDPLTGVLSRAAILETLRLELLRSQREQTTVGIVLADLDHFKQVNDTYGHLAGDSVLQEAARRMRSAVRPYDAVGRYGGEEFLIVMPGCDISGTMSRAEGLRNAVGKGPVDAPEGVIPVTLSLGVTVGGGADLAESAELLRAADAALYDAKKNGRNRAAVSGEGGELSADSSQPMTGDILEQSGFSAVGNEVGAAALR